MFNIFLTIELLVLFSLVLSQAPNACKNFNDYYKKSGNPNCWYNPEMYLETEDFARKYGYPIENYTVTTEDGYILTMYRIPKPINARGVIFLQHPATSSSSVWLDKGNKSLAFMLYDSGYDVWLPNSRGNKYSRRHVSLSPDQVEFWEHTFHEMSVYDIRAQLGLVQNVTNVGPNVAFIGHSMGGTLGVLYPTLFPEEAEKYLGVSIVGAPAVQFNYIPNRISSVLVGNLDFIYGLAKAFNLLEIISPVLSPLYHAFCTIYPAGIEFCANIISWVFGPSVDFNQMVPERFPHIFNQAPCGVSLKVFIHYMQCSRSRRFQQYDLGPRKNLELYNSTKPAPYRVEDIRVPMVFISGSKDNLCTPRDNHEIYKRIPRKYRRGHVIIEGFNHMDFVYGRDFYVFDKYIMKQVNRFFNSRERRVTSNDVK